MSGEIKEAPYKFERGEDTPVQRASLLDQPKDQNSLVEWAKEWAFCVRHPRRAVVLDMYRFCADNGYSGEDRIKRMSLRALDAEVPPNLRYVGGEFIDPPLAVIEVKSRIPVLGRWGIGVKDVKVVPTLEEAGSNKVDSFVELRHIGGWGDNSIHMVARVTGPGVVDIGEANWYRFDIKGTVEGEAINTHPELKGRLRLGVPKT